MQILAFKKKNCMDYKRASINGCLIVQKITVQSHVKSIQINGPCRVSKLKGLMCIMRIQDI